MRNVPNIGYIADPYREKLSLFQYLKSPFGAQTAQGHIPHLSPWEMICTVHREKLIPRVSWKPSASSESPANGTQTTAGYWNIPKLTQLCFQRNYKAKKRTKDDILWGFLCGFNHTANALEEGERERDLWREKVSLSPSSALFRHRMKSHFVGWLENDAAT